MRIVGTRGERCLSPLLILVILLFVPPARAATVEDRLAEAQELLDAEQAEEALGVLDRVLRKRPEEPRALLLRSTAHFMLGEKAAGRQDLERALVLDPGLRQGWMNKAALEIAEKRYDAALAALEKARDLEPQAPDNGLNLGAVLLLLGRLEAASSQFDIYLKGTGSASRAHYLVAGNYALAGYAALALSHLETAIRQDEKLRLEARTDPNFADLAGNAAFQDLLATDLYQPPPGAYTRAKEYDVSYDGGESRLLGAVIEALQLTGEPFDPRVEATRDWALIWSDIRIKVTNGPDGRGRIELTAPAERFQPVEWNRKVEALLRQIDLRLALSRG